ncbi:myrosinase 1-like [Diorhabda carinulata]|uniref:myrosinase 1-like n=1 Tax=Diorhabda carinulata TaxID=1163345 RepID=UPI0025A25341|nr:myrosinase 1-like [Diorhabda carinulata]
MVTRTVTVTKSENKLIPKSFPFGASTSAYQIEGAWIEDGKGESIWDYYFHNGKGSSSLTNGDIACDSYHKYKEDIHLAANLGLTMFRFSISWPRILPNGNPKEINQKGIDHYRSVIEEMLKYNLTPVATLYHWDLPQHLFEKGYHWTNPEVVPYFVDYARIVIKSLPKVGIWITLNEPRLLCRLGYGVGVNAPSISRDGIDDYLCAYTTIKAHAAVYHMYKAEFPNYTEAKIYLIAFI